MISIIIPTLNEEKYLAELLDLIKGQDFSDYEVIVSDGESEDQTLKIAKNYNCKIVEGSKNKRHPSIQRNRGAKIAQGDIFLFLDADTRFYDKYFLKKIYNNFKKENLGVAAFYLDFQSNKFFYKFFYCFYNFFAFLGQYIKPLSVGAGIAIRENIHKKIGGFNESIFIGEDHYYCGQAFKFSKFRLIRDTKIFFSIRRFKKEGEWGLFFKILYSAFYVLFVGPIKKKIVKYEFGKH